MSDFDTQQSGTATPQPEPSPVPSDTGTPSPQQTATPSAPQPGATQPGGNEALVPSYRLREVREAYERKMNEEFARRDAETKRQIAEYERKVQALAGVLPQEQTQADQVMEQYYKLFPHHKNLTPEKLEQLDKALQRLEALDAENELRWQSYGNQQLNSLFKLAYDAGLPDSDATRNRLHTALIGYLQVNPQEQQRFASDPNFVSEFFKAYAAEMIDPLRRSTVVAQQNRVAPNIPQDTPSGAVRTTTGAAKPANLNERAALSWTAFQQSKNSGV